MAIRTTVSSGTSWESQVGYSRAVRARNHVFVSGTTATDDSGHIHCEGDAYGQAVYIFNKIRHALEQADANMSDVVRTRMYVVNIKDWESVAKAHAEFFGEIKPASTMVEVSRLINDKHLVEIEADAIV